MISLKTLHIFRGPSPESDEPAVEVLLSAEAADLAPLPAAAERLGRLLGRWFKPSAAPTADLLSAGRYTAELARALVSEHGGVVEVAKARLAPGGVILTLGQHKPEASLLAIEAATRLALGSAKVADAEIAKALETLWRTIVPMSPDAQATVLLRHARAAGVPVRGLDTASRLWLYGWGARSDIFFEASPRADSVIGANLASSKPVTKQVALSAGFRVLASAVVGRAEELGRVAEGLGFPCVTKPLNDGQSRGVTVGIRDLDGLKAGWAAAQAVSKGPVLVERHAEGEACRLTVLQGKLWKAVLRPRPTVTGDGRSNVLQLAKARNEALAATLRPSSLLRPAPIDPAFEACVRRQGLTPASVPAAGAKVIIRDIPLLSQGATEYADVTARLHPDLRAAAEDLARLLGAGSLGIDLVAEDISRPETCHFLEANLTPGLRLLLAAGFSAQDIGRAVLGEKPGRVPATLVIAPRAEHARIREGSPAKAGQGWTDGRAVGLAGRTFPTAVRSTQDGVDLLVRNPSVESLLVLADPEDLLAGGLPLDRVDQAVIAAGAALPPEWEALVRRVSAKVETGK